MVDQADHSFDLFLRRILTIRMQDLKDLILLAGSTLAQQVDDDEGPLPFGDITTPFLAVGT